MTQPLMLSAGAQPMDRSTFKDRLSFWTCVFVVLTFTQFWVMPLTGPDGDAEASTVIRVLYFPAYVATLVLAVVQMRQTIATAVRAPLLWLIMATVFISMTWSIDPAVTARRGVAVFFTSLAGVVVASRYSWPRLLEAMSTAFAIVVVVCFALALLLPSYGKMTALFPGAWRGAWFEKNGLGDNMGVACIAFCATAILNPRRRWLWVGMAVSALGLVLLSTSKTSLVSLALGLAGIGFVSLVKRGPVMAVIATFLGVSAVLSLGFGSYFASDAFFALLGKDPTLTGRTNLWAPVFEQIQTRPWTGFGYAAVWNDTTNWGPLAWISKQAKFVAVHSHNSWLEVWLGLGLIGLSLFALYFMEVWVRTIVAVYRSPAGYFALPFLMVYSLMTLTENVAVVYDEGLIWMLFVVLSVKLAASSRSDEPTALEVRFAAPAP